MPGGRSRTPTPFAATSRSTPSASSLVCRPGTRGYRTPSHKFCCANNWVTAHDLDSWFRIDSSVVSVEDDMAYISVTLSFRDISSTGQVSWKDLRWVDLGEMHGRKVHASAVATDLHAAWHVHPLEGMRDTDTQLTFSIRLPPRRPGDESALQVRLLLNFGVRADASGVDLCVSEDSVHVDPDPGSGVEMMVEGQATTELLTLRPSSGEARLPLQPDYAAARTIEPMPLDGRGGEEVQGGAAITTELEARCAAGASACWRVQLRAGLLDADYFAALKRAVAGGHATDARLFADASGGDAAAVDELSVNMGGGAGTCVGLSVWVEDADAAPAAAALASYLTMGAHAIVAREGGHAR